MVKILLSIFLFMTVLNAEEMGLKGGSCTLVQEGAVVVSFEAYKTPAKVGVGGVFDSVKYTPTAPSGKNFREIFVGSQVSIDTASVNSKNETRDDKLVKFFFDTMTGKNITAKISDYKPNKLFKGKPKTGVFIVEVTMNGVTKTVPMNYSFDAGVMVANGVIDILDFSANEALSSINKACYDLHGGKTWSDVSIGFTTKVSYSLCHVDK
ncbi:YceI-like domain-containing protein [Epsilonproteobacteria bacterium SCGC AD-308-P11]|nr:YceI-like domain-containing protein [Epsilonproteobacteria bacterium SCGC AD-308-P11]